MSENQLDRVDHITVCVADIAAAVQWYRTSFVCELLVQEKLFAKLQFENVVVELVLPSQEPPHLAFRKPDAHTYGELLQKLDGSFSTFVSDPTGNFVELIGEK